ncbi:MAG: hypothetical protein MRJ92_08790 [Nitrospira sp.]|nr:hypothetical protein [Nitrospira sp.]
MPDFTTNLLTWLTQLFVTNRLVVLISGLVVALLSLPAQFSKFLGIALWPGFRGVRGLSVLRRHGGICAFQTGA